MLTSSPTQINSSLSKVPKRSILDILKDSLADKPKDSQEGNEVRYKLIIDSSEDSSLLRLLFAFEVLKYDNTRTYVCSDFPGDSHQNMVGLQLYTAHVQHMLSICTSHVQHMYITCIAHARHMYSHMTCHYSVNTTSLLSCIFPFPPFLFDPPSSLPPLPPSPSLITFSHSRSAL